MAWFGRIDSAPQWDGEHIFQVVNYYDDKNVDVDGNPVTVFAHTFKTNLETTWDDLVKEIIVTGQAARKAQEMAAAIAASAPVGKLIQIP